MKKLLASLPILAVAAALVVPVTGAATQTITVKETNFKIRLAAVPRAGKVRFVIKNASGIEHDFHLRGGGIERESRELRGGQTAVLTATLKRGVRYRVWCGVGGHAAAGMKTSFVAR